MYSRTRHLLELLLRAQLARARLAVLLAADVGTRVEAGVAHAADLLVLVEALGELLQRRLDDAAAEAQHQVQGRL